MSKECEICLTLQKSALNQCPACNKQACQFCLPVSDDSVVCIFCVRVKLREELIVESLQRKVQLEKLVVDLMDSAQSTQLDIEHLSDKTFHLESLMKSSEVTHLSKISSLESNIKHTRSNSVSYSTIDNLEAAVANQKKIEKTARAKYQQAMDDLESEEIDLSNQKEMERLLQNRVIELRNLSVNSVPYEDIRGWVCEKCSKTIKIRFREMILGGNQGSDSIVSSVINVKGEERDHMSVGSLVSRKTFTKAPAKKYEKEHKCSCLII